MTVLHKAVAKALHLFESEPVACVALFHAVVTLAASFGLHLSAAQLAEGSAVLTAAEAVFVRSRVSA